jgi:hypothetical protein
MGQKSILFKFFINVKHVFNNGLNVELDLEHIRCLTTEENCAGSKI